MAFDARYGIGISGAIAALIDPGTGPDAAGLVCAIASPAPALCPPAAP